MSARECMDGEMGADNFLSYHASKDNLNMPSFGNLRNSDGTDLEQ